MIVIFSQAKPVLTVTLDTANSYTYSLLLTRWLAVANLPLVFSAILTPDWEHITMETCKSKRKDGWL